MNLSKIRIFSPSFFSTFKVYPCHTTGVSAEEAIGVPVADVPLPVVAESAGPGDGQDQGGLTEQDPVVE